MALPTNRQPGDVISASDINDIATQVNTNETAITGKLSTSGGTMSGAINMGSKKITNLATPTANADAATKKYVDDKSYTITLTNAKSWYTTAAGFNQTFWNNNTGGDVIIQGSVYVNGTNGLWVRIGDASGALSELKIYPVDQTTKYYAVPISCIVQSTHYMELDIYDADGNSLTANIDLIAYKFTI